jgi:hypothetical protein
MKGILHLKDDFESIMDFHRWMDIRSEKVYYNSLQISRITSKLEDELDEKSDWYGAGRSLEEIKKGPTKYIAPEMLTELRQNVDEIPAIRDASPVKEKRVDYNARGLGVFSFDRAAMGLHKVKLESGKVVARTNNKKVFAYFPKSNRPKPAVEIYLTAGGPARVDAKGLLYSALSGILVAEKLQKEGAKVKIHVLIGSKSGWEMCVAAIPVKDWSEQVDADLLALMTSDSGYYRHTGFRALIHIWDHFGKEVPDRLGEPVRPAIIDDLIKEKYPEKNILVFGGSHSESAVLKDLKEANTMIEKLIQK